jgi:hypothetical protein
MPIESRRNQGTKAMGIMQGDRLRDRSESVVAKRIVSRG